MLTSSTKSARRLPGGGPSTVRRRLSSRSSIIDCVDPADVCAEKLSCTASHAPVLASSERTRCVRTLLPTPEPPQTRVGTPASRLAESRNAERTVSTVGTSTSKKGVDGE